MPIKKNYICDLNVFTVPFKVISLCSSAGFHWSCNLPNWVLPPWTSEWTSAGIMAHNSVIDEKKKTLLWLVTRLTPTRHLQADFFSCSTKKCLLVSGSEPEPELRSPEIIMTMRCWVGLIQKLKSTVKLQVCFKMSTGAETHCLEKGNGQI